MLNVPLKSDINPQTKTFADKTTRKKPGRKPALTIASAYGPNKTERIPRIFGTQKGDWLLILYQNAEGTIKKSLIRFRTGKRSHKNWHKSILLIWRARQIPSEARAVSYGDNTHTRWVWSVFRVTWSPPSTPQLRVISCACDQRLEEELEQGEEGDRAEERKRDWQKITAIGDYHNIMKLGLAS